MYLVESEGFKWVIRPGTDDHLGPGHENWLNSVMWIPSGGVFIDVGAHVGHFTVRLSKTASHVYAFEPGPIQLRGLRKNLQLNGITNVTVFPEGVSNEVGVCSVSTPGGYGQMQISKDPQGTIKTVTLDSLLAYDSFADRVDLVKIDVQGHEAKVLEGMHKFVAHYKPRLVIELHDKEFNDPFIWEDVQLELDEMGYKWTKIGEFGTNWWIEATPNV